MREKRILYGILGLAVFFLLANPVMVNATSNDQRISGTGDPGSCTYIEPAVDGNDDLAAAVYIKHDTNEGSYKLKMKISTDDGETWSQNPININPTQSQKQRYPDVAVSKIQADGIIKDVIFVTWQEWKIDSWWEIWVCNFTYYNGNLSYQGRMRVSEHNGPYTEALLPRISVDYVPEVNHDGDYIDYSATFGIIVFQQERGDPSHPSLFKIMYTDFIHDTTDLNGQGNGHPMITPHVWPLPMEIPGQTNQEFDNRYPSTDIDAYTREPYTSWSQPCCEIDIVFDNKYDDLAFQCIRLGGYVEGGKDNPCLNWTYGGSYDDTFNIGSSTWGYPDCAVRWEGSYHCNYHEAVVWQADNNIPKTLSFKPSVTYEISLGICRTPQIKGISIDMTEVQYEFIPKRIQMKSRREKTRISEKDGSIRED